MNYKKEIGRRLAEARKSHGWSLEDLSRKLNGVLSKSRISNYEQGTRTPGPMEANILAHALESDAAWIMCLSTNLNLQESKLIKDWRVLPEKDRNDYARRISVLATIYKEPVADERLVGWERKRPKRKVSPTRKVRKT